MQMRELHVTGIGELIEHQKHAMHVELFGSSKLTQHTVPREQAPSPSLSYYKCKCVRRRKASVSPIHLDCPANFS